MFAKKNHPTPMKIKHVTLSLALVATSIASATVTTPRRTLLMLDDRIGIFLAQIE